MSEIYDYLIVGGGAAGLGVASLLQKKNLKTLVLEAHYYPGGCASYFYRDKHSFDVGATTLSGIKDHGPLTQFIKAVELEINLKKIDPGIISIIDHKKISHYAHDEKYLLELNKLFSTDHSVDLKKFISSANVIEKKAFELINQNYIPKRNLLELVKLISIKQLNNYELVKLLFQNYADYIPHILLENENFKKVFNEILFITTQNNIYDTPALFGILGSRYPSDTYYPMGGMQNFITQLASKAGPIRLRTKVEKISKKDDIFIISTSKGEFKSKNIISTLPHENNLALFNHPLPKNLSEKKWSAFSLYFTVPKLDINSLYYQIHTGPIPILNTESFFASFSDPEDILRNKNQRLTVTISTHTNYFDFNELSPAAYQAQKELIKNFILEKFCFEFNLVIEDIQHLEIGTPKTFERFTNRFQGLVGGAGHHVNQSIKSRIYYHDLEKNFYEIGDNIMPGQGVAAVLYGALALTDFLNRKS